ncbi:ABC transporter permease, partial [Escherichia coli]|nr:ABC transporter permease [Escherichia coli]
RPHDTLGASERFSALFFSSLSASLTAFAYLPMVFIQRPIFYRERAERMYRTATYAIGYILSDIPMIFIGTFAFAVSFYFF